MILEPTPPPEMSRGILGVDEKWHIDVVGVFVRVQ
jgi:hypothetical protein